MDFEKLLEIRHSTRQFTDKKVNEDDLKEAIRLALTAPTSKNDQPQKLIVVLSDNKANLLKKSLGQDYNASNFLIIAYDEKNSRTRDYKNLNGGILSTSIFAGFLTLTLQYKNINSIWIGASDLEQIKKDFDLKDVSPIGVLAIGYEEKEELKQKKRKSVEEITEFV
ncbi:MAG: nitroreductase family protein [Tissierellia bacterium]|nr:nitroreductase family protein [Tissierellia bacterium]